MNKIKWWFLLKKNTFKKFLVNKLIGNELMIIQPLDKSEIEFVDIKKRLNYGKWKVKKINEYKIMITR